MADRPHEPLFKLCTEFVDAAAKKSKCPGCQTGDQRLHTFNCPVLHAVWVLDLFRYIEELEVSNQSLRDEITMLRAAPILTRKLDRLDPGDH